MGFTLYLLLQSIWQLPSRAEQETTPVPAAVMEQMLEFAPLKLKFIISSLKLLMGGENGHSLVLEPLFFLPFLSAFLGVDSLPSSIREEPGTAEI